MLGGFLKISSVSNIRHIPRTGWVLRGVPPSIAETISDHIVLVMLVSLKITEKLLESGYNLDIAKVLIMGLLHDLPETVTGDIVRYVKEEDPSYFRRLDEKSLEMLGMSRYIGVYREFEEKKTLESIVVKISDSLATIIEGRRLESQGYFEVKEIVENMMNQVKHLISSVNDPALRNRLNECVREIMEN